MSLKKDFLLVGTLVLTLSVKWKDPGADEDENLERDRACKELMSATLPEDARRRESQLRTLGMSTNV